MDVKEIREDIDKLKSAWTYRNTKFKDWMDVLTLVDKLQRRGLESYVSNEPRTFFNMSLYLMTAGDTRHTIPAEGDSSIELDKQSKVERACAYMWRMLDEERMRGGAYPFLHELCFNILVFGWYSMIAAFDTEQNKPILQVWSPNDVSPRYEDGRLTACVHEYSLDVKAAKRKAAANDWNYNPKITMGDVILQDYFYVDEHNVLQNLILIDSQPVTAVVPRENLLLLVAPVGGFPETSIQQATNWSVNLGQGIFAANTQVYEALNKWTTFQLQLLRETAEPKWQEISSGAPKVEPERLRERGAVFQFSPGEGIQPIQSAPPPIELRGIIEDLKRELQKGSFTDTVYGMAGGERAGYILSQMASSSANQILAPYVKAKHFIIAECDRFWLRSIKTSKKVFVVKGKLLEKLRPTDIPEDVELEASSELATPKDWLERATVANMLERHLDNTTILDTILKVQDVGMINRRKSTDLIMTHPLSLNLRLIQAYRGYAKYMEYRGDREQAAMFLKAAEALESQMGAPPPGAAKPAEAAEAEAKRAAAAPPRRPRVRPEISPPEKQMAFTPEELGAMGLPGRS